MYRRPRILLPVKVVVSNGSIEGCNQGYYIDVMCAEIINEEDKGMTC